MLRAFLYAWCFLCLLLVSCGGEVSVSFPGCEDCPGRCLQVTESRGRCVTCLTDIHCRTIPGSKKICTSNNKCICGANSDCPNNLFCGGPKGCLSCLENKDCPKGKPICSNNDCVACEPGQVRTCQPEGDLACKPGTQKCKLNGSWDVCQDFVVCSSDEECKRGTCVPLPCVPGKACVVPAARGACAEGITSCDSLGVKQCNPRNKPKKEECTGKDDNCDGEIDNIDTFNQPCQAPNRKGDCAKGIWACLNNQRTCVPARQPEPEICDGLDNNCDGKIDNGVIAPFASKIHGVCSGLKKVCKGKSGWQEPDYTKVPGYQAKETLCDDLDNDCDAKVDEGFPTKGNACTSGQGICKRPGQLSCTEDKKGLECLARKGNGTPEVCNGVDDNCNGQIDENVTRKCYNGPANTSGVGTCKDGTHKCQNGKWPKSCPGEVVPQVETCNNKDDNCDGKVDNLPHSATACCTPKCKDGPEVTINTLNFKGMSFYPIHLDKCTTKGGACCKSSTTKEQMDAFCRLAGKCRAISWTIKTIKNSDKCYCWGTCTKCIWFPNCCSGLDDRNFITSVKCR